MRFIAIIKLEWKHFIRVRAKLVALLLFVFAMCYGLFNGWTLYNRQITEIEKYTEKQSESIAKTVSYFDQGLESPEDAPWINFTNPFWAVWYSSTIAVKKPSPMTIFSIGQSEDFAYYKEVSVWSTTLDNDMAEEISNPERRSLSTLDFSFALLYLLPLTLIVLLYNVGGQEKDNNSFQFIQIQVGSIPSWLIPRFVFYFALVMLVLFFSMSVFSVLTEISFVNFNLYLKICFVAFIYTLVWTTILYFVNLYGRGSRNQAIKSISIYLLFCLIIPGAVHQITLLKHPTNYMTEFIDVNRDGSSEIWSQSEDSIRKQLVQLYPDLINSKGYKEKAVGSKILDYSSSPLVNQLMKEIAKKHEDQNRNRNNFVGSLYWLNPVSFLQNRINAICETDYQAFAIFKNTIQNKIDLMNHKMVFDMWDKKTVKKEDIWNTLNYLVMSTNLTETTGFFIGNKPAILHTIHLPAVNIAIYKRNIDLLNSEIKLLINTLNKVRIDGSVATILRQLSHNTVFDDTPFFLKDLEEILTVFESVTLVKSFRFLLEIVDTDMCHKFHTDMNDLRLLCTYSGPATEWLTQGQEDQLSHLDPNDLFAVPENYNKCSTGDVIILKGALYVKPDTRAVYHRSPPIEKLRAKRLLLRIDTNENMNFWE